MDLEDRLALHELPGRYGDFIDDRNWAALDQIFLPEATFEVPGFVMQGLDGIRAFMDAEGTKHPRTHTMTNVYVDETPNGVVLRFRILAMQTDGRIRSLRYRDIVVKTPDGWRVATRVVTPTPWEEPASA
jgi:hypothetical protein